MGRRDAERGCEPTLVEKLSHYFRYRVIARLAGACGFAVDETVLDDYLPQLELSIDYSESELELHDERARVFDGPDGVDLTLTVEGLAAVLGSYDAHEKRILEVGPKYGYHSRWIDRELSPKEMVFSDFEQDSHIHDKWKGEISCSSKWLYGDLCEANKLLEMEQFDMVLFLGVLYHSIYPLKMLSMLNRATKMGGRMLLETTCTRQPGSVMRLRWVGNGRAKALPSVDALRVMLAWTGWSKMTRFVRYRPLSTEVLFMCEKTHEVPENSDFCELVPPHKV